MTRTIPRSSNRRPHLPADLVATLRAGDRTGLGLGHYSDELLWPTDPAAVHTLTLLREATAAGAARRFVLAVCAKHNIAEAVAELAELLVSELVTNAFRHAAPPPKDIPGVADVFDLTITVLPGGQVLIEVHDFDPRPPRVVPEPAAEDVRDLDSDLGLAGAGMRLWQYVPVSAGVRPDEQATGKTVWALVGATGGREVR